MQSFLTQWGLEIILAIIVALTSSTFAYQASQYRKKREQYRELVREQEERNTENIIEEKLEPIYTELQDLRTYIHETQNIEKSHMNLIVASYRFRLIQLCKQFIKQKYMTQAQYDQLSEFYKLYIGLGGNGQAEDYYKRVIKLPIHEDDEE